MNIAIVDDQKVFLDIIREILSYLDYDLYFFTSVFDMEKIGIDFDLVLLDIDMPDYDGIKYAKNHKELNIVFITSREDRIKESFGQNVYGFISKDDKEERYINVIEESLQQIRDQKMITIKSGYDYFQFMERDIVYLMYLDYKTIGIVYRDKSYTIKGYSLKDIKEMLSNQFVFIDKSTIVNLKMIISLVDDGLYLNGLRQPFTISRRKKEMLRKYLKK